MDSSDSLLRRMTENAGMQKDQLDSFSKQLSELTKRNEEKIESMRKTLENQLRILQEDNSRKLEQMRATVDEKLQSTLEKRLGESFKQVSERLEQVYKAQYVHVRVEDRVLDRCRHGHLRGVVVDHIGPLGPGIQ